MAPEGNTLQILLTLAVAAAALGLFAWGRLRVELVGLLVMVSLMVLGLVTPQQGISGFANEATITVAAMLVLSTGLIRTGVVDLLAAGMARTSGKGATGMILAVLVTVLPLSAFLNNTAVVAVFLPVLLGLSRVRQIAPSCILMPLSFGSQLGGTLTLIGTSTNLLAAGLVLDFGLPRIRLFDITPPALFLTAAGCLYLLTVGRWLTPIRAAASKELSSLELREYLSTLEVQPHSRWLGRPLTQLPLQSKYSVELVGIQRGPEPLRAVRPYLKLQAGDRLVVRGKTAALKQVDQVDGMQLVRRTESLPPLSGGAPERLAEVVVPLRSHFVGRRLSDLHFLSWYRVVVLALQRHGEVLQGPIEDQELLPGDVLLVEGTDEALLRMHEGGSVALVGPLEVPSRRTGKSWIALGTMVAVVVLAAVGVAPIVMTALAGMVVMFLTGCLTSREARNDVDWSVVILLGTLIPLGIAMQNTGAARMVAMTLLHVTQAMGPYGVLATVYLLTSLLTEMLSNNASVVVMVPIAASLGMALGLSPMPFIIAVMFAGSNSFMTPIGYQTNTFIYGPGGYRFSDFVRVGGPLNALLVPVATVVIPMFFPFEA